MKINMDWYNLYLRSYNIEVDAVNSTTVQFVMTSPGDGPNLTAFAKDVSVLNAIRSNTDPTVKDQWEQLLTTVALTAGRDAPDVIDSMIQMGKDD